MYGFKKDINLDFLQGRQLRQICVGPLQLQFNFDGDVMIHVGSMVHIYKKKTSTPEIWKSEEKSIPPGLFGLIEQVIASFDAQPDGTLTIRFASQDTLVIFDDSKQYESYQLYHASRTIVV